MNGFLYALRVCLLLLMPTLYGVDEETFLYKIRAVSSQFTGPEKLFGLVSLSSVVGLGLLNALQKHGFWARYSGESMGALACVSGLALITVHIHASIFPFDF